MLELGNIHNNQLILKLTAIVNYGSQLQLLSTNQKICMMFFLNTVSKETPIIYISHRCYLTMFQDLRHQMYVERKYKIV